MSSRWWFYGLFRACRDRGLDRPGSWLRHGGGVSEPAFSRGADLLPAQDSAADLQHRGRPHREFGEEKRAFVKIEQTPDILRKAIIAAEDERFYEHGGVDYIAWVRATLSNFAAASARRVPAPSPCRVARNFFLSTEKTFSRKFNEALLAFKIEHSLTKDEILQLYINQIYLGQRAYGFGAAALVYFGKPLDQLNLGEIAMLAGLPKAPSRLQPGGST